jgi:hypothetical protein
MDFTASDQEGEEDANTRREPMNLDNEWAAWEAACGASEGQGHTGLWRVASHWPLTDSWIDPDVRNLASGAGKYRPGVMCRRNRLQLNLYIRRGAGFDIDVMQRRLRKHPYVRTLTLRWNAGKLENPSPSDHESPYNVRFMAADGITLTGGLSSNGDPDGVAHVWLGGPSTWTETNQCRVRNLMLNILGHKSVFHCCAQMVQPVAASGASTAPEAASDATQSHEELPDAARGTSKGQEVHAEAASVGSPDHVVLPEAASGASSSAEGGYYQHPPGAGVQKQLRFAPEPETREFTDGVDGEPSGEHFTTAWALLETFENENSVVVMTDDMEAGAGPEFVQDFSASGRCRNLCEIAKVRKLSIIRQQKKYNHPWFLQQYSTVALEYPRID